MIKNYLSFYLKRISTCLFLFVSTGAFAGTHSIVCDSYIDSSPLIRATGFSEEQVMNGVYQGYAQQYNGMAGQINSVRFWGRVNPASGNTTNTLTVRVYRANIGLPGVILGSQNVTVDSTSTNYQVDAIFSSPIALGTSDTSIIISVEPLSPSVDDYYIQRNDTPNGQFTNLIKIKQANQWFKNLVFGDPAYDYDFMILPVQSTTVTANFTSNTSSNLTTFTNTSSGGTSYLWEFGDGDTSTSPSPSHSYTASATYNVTLKAFTSGIGPCVDSVTIPVTVVLTGTNNLPAKKEGLVLLSNSVHNTLTVESSKNTTVYLMNILGNRLGKYDLKQNLKQQIDVSRLEPGIYFLNSSNQKAIRFVKTKHTD